MKATTTMRQALSFECCKRAVRSGCDENMKMLTQTAASNMEKRTSRKVGWGMIMD
jgi:lysozyme family protein